jgi:hypothetical protein
MSGKSNGFAHHNHLERQDYIRKILATLEDLDSMTDEEYQRAVAGVTPEELETLRRILTKIKEARREMEG